MLNSNLKKDLQRKFPARIYSKTFEKIEKIAIKEKRSMNEQINELLELGIKQKRLNN